MQGFLATAIAFWDDCKYGKSRIRCAMRLQTPLWSFAVPNLDSVISLIGQNVDGHCF
jgi:hypothetical protein